MPVVTRPPVIARAAGITVGLTTIEGFERRYGKALRRMGGHSGGAGEWYDVRHSVLIDVDGFNLSRDGEILDGFRIAWMPEGSVGKGVPRIRLQRADLGLLGKLRRGMSRRQAEAALGSPLRDDTIRRSGLVRYVPKPVNKANDRYARWSLHLDFGAKGLESFVVDAD